MAQSENHCDNVHDGFQGNQADHEVKEIITGVAGMDGVRGDPYNSRALPAFLIALRWGAAPVVLWFCEGCEVLATRIWNVEIVAEKWWLSALNEPSS